MMETNAVMSERREDDEREDGAETKRRDERGML